MREQKTCYAQVGIGGRARMYIGNALLQKTFINNHLEKKRLPNQGELTEYYVTETHPALIDPKTFETVQQRLADLAEKNSGRTDGETSELSGMIRCPNCGKNFRRVSVRKGKAWVCPTYYIEGKQYCQSKKILETVLKTVIAEALGLDTWIPEVFKNQVEYIITSGPNTLELHMMDGKELSLEWQDRSRAESWTEEMREKARQNAYRRHHG